jgi:predicted Zn finger-like uncharacterized protein
MPTLTSCPSCSKQLKVPDELLGRQVKCPQCGTTFTATAAVTPGGPPPPPSPQHPFAPPPAPPTFPGSQPIGGYEEPPPITPRATGNRLKGPGIALLINSILMLLLWGYSIISGVMAVSNPANAVQSTVEMQEMFSEMFGKKLTDEEKEKLRKDTEAQMKIQAPLQLVFSIVGFLLAILSIFGSIMMINGRKGGLAWTAAVLNVIPCTASCCCLTGIPIGIWAMIALKNS